MRLALFDLDHPNRRDFYPLSLSRPIFDLRSGLGTLAEKLIARAGTSDVAYFVPAYLAPSVRARAPERRVNDPALLHGEDLLLLNARVRPEALGRIDLKGPSLCGHDDRGEVTFVWLRREDAAGIERDSIDTLLISALANLPGARFEVPQWRYTWELVLENGAAIKADFAAAGRQGIEGTVEQPFALRGSPKDLFIAPGAVVQPMVVIDCSGGPVFLDEGVEIHPFTRIEGPCYVGKKSILLGAKCREGTTIGPMCRVGGEVEESILQGFSNKYHDGFLGHAYVGEWVNLGALTTNSDLKNDYGSVEVSLDGRHPVDTRSMKVGALIGDHTKTSIGTLFNTGSYVGAMSLVMATGKPLPKYIPEFSWLLDGLVTKGFGKGKLYETAKLAMARRKCQWTEVDEQLWDAIFQITAPQREEALKRGRRQMLKV